MNDWYYIHLRLFLVYIPSYLFFPICFIIRWFGDICKKKKRETNILFFNIVFSLSLNLYVIYNVLN